MGFISRRPEAVAAMESAVRRALEACGTAAEGYAKEQVPVVTGRLRDSISHSVGDKEFTLGADTPYASLVELGSHQRPAKPYLRPAVEDHKSEYIQIIRQELENG